MRLFSPAKVNLLLAVTGKRPDGFHDLVSLVSPVSFGDYLTISLTGKTGEMQLSCTDPEVPTDRTNLVIRAAEAFLDRVGDKWGLEIHLEKRIPMEAGLGGGSSNAATALLVLNRFLGEPMSFETLCEMAAGIGSDCPLFLYRQPVLMRGRGERIETLPQTIIQGLNGRMLAIFKPSFGISTAWAFQRLAETPGRYAVGDATEGRVLRWQAGELPLGKLLCNTFEYSVFEKFIPFPALFDLVKEEMGLNCLLSGSGSACFVLLENTAQQETLRTIVKEAWGREVFFEICSLGTESGTNASACV